MEESHKLITSDKNSKSSNFDSKYDRLLKYGFGFIRLAFLIFIMIMYDAKLNLKILLDYNRYLNYFIFAIFGGCINVKLLPKKLEILTLLVIITLAFYDLSFDFTVLLYTTKTFIPDFFASKLDRKIWKFLLFLCIIGVFGSYFILNYNFFDYINIWIVLSLAQLFSELGDQYFENLMFFRHRYSFEIASLIIWIFFVKKGIRTDNERKLFYFDLIASLSYRMTGFLLKLKDFDFRFKGKKIE